MIAEGCEMEINGLKEVVDQFEKTCVLVIGDFMLDTFIQGTVSRIAPTAPVPVVDFVSEIFRPGGAANAVSNIRALGGDAVAVGVIGDDENGRKLIDLLKQDGVDTECMIVSEDRPTTVKTRIIGGQQQIVRVDREVRDAINHECTKNILNFLNERISEVDAILVSDYDKGVVTNGLLGGLIALAKKFNKPVVVHPRIVHFLDYRGVTVVNSSDEVASTVTGIRQINETSIRNMGQWLLTQLECEYVLITHGSNGMTLFGKNGDVRQMPSIAREVHNVTGVGTDDTVTGVIALSLAQGVTNMVNSAILANIAAGIVISKSGPATVTKDELKERIDALSGMWKVS